MVPQAIKIDIRNYSLKRRALLPTLWDSIDRIRFLLCLLVFLYSFFDPHIRSRGQLWVVITVYAVFNFSLRLFGSSILYLKRVRVFPPLSDVIFVSLLVYNSTGPGNSWFLFYLFPIISVSRDLGYRGTLSLACCSIASYLLVYIYSGQSMELEAHWFVMRGLVLVGVGAVAASLARTREKELARLTEVHEEIDHAILSERQLDQILNLILKKGLAFTNSAIGHIRLLDRETGEDQTVTTIGYPDRDGEVTRPLADGYSRMAIEQKEPIIIHQIRPKNLRHYLGTYFMSLRPGPSSALYVPLKVKDSIIGIIVVYSDWNHHYTKMDVRRLTAFTPLIEMALRTVESAERLRRLTETQTYYRDLIVNSPDPITVLDKDGKIAVFNRACEELWGLSYEEVRSQPVANYYESAEHAKEIGKLMWHSESNRVENVEARVKARNGEIIPISLSACFVRNEKGERDGSIGMFKDRRVAIKMEEKLLQAERLAVVGRLAGTAGHDIRHNIATALNYVDGLLYKCDPEQEPKLHRIYSDINSALRDSVDQLKNLLTANQPKLPQKAAFVVSEIFQRVEERMHRQALDNNIQFVVCYPKKDCELCVDLEQIAEVFSNLFTNSLQAIEKRKETDDTFEAGLIEVSVNVNPSHAQLKWKDNGCGISEADSKNIFNAFVTSKGSKGTGLGLFIVKTIVENHDGEIEVEARPEEGAIFQITLPILHALRRDSDGSIDH